MSLEDKSIECTDCGEAFVWTMREQEFYTQKGFTPPKRCADCRKKKKERMAAKAKKR